MYFFFLFIGTPGMAFSLVPVGLTLGTLLPLYYYLRTVEQTFRSIQEENRLMYPGQVWYILIPGFGLVWNFIVLMKFTDSLKKEFDSQGIPYSEERPGFVFGLLTAISYCGIFIPFLCYFAIPAWIVFLIIYWTRVDDFKRELKDRKK